MDTVTKPKISPEILESFQEKFEEEKQVIVHCCFPATVSWGNLIRVWRSTYLIDQNSGHKSKLIHAENISFFPDWTAVPPFKDYWFTLVFSGLPKDCEHFDLIENIPEENGFCVEGIRRNRSDIYKVKI
ncbi:MAG: hypothetical protein QM564_01585 [Bergeyella sp.]